MFEEFKVINVFFMGQECFRFLKRYSKPLFRNPLLTYMNFKGEVYFITSNEFGYTHEEITESALKAGIKFIQLREKRMSSRELLKTAINIRKLCDEYGSTFIVNDRVDIALCSNADGVHVGQDDIPAEDVRKIFRGIIGVSANNLDQALASQKYADYIGVGPVFPTLTKKDAKNPVGLNGLRNIVESVKIPVFAIGSITYENVTEVLRTGVDGVAVISAIAGSKEPEKEAKKIIKKVRGFIEEFNY